MLKGCSLQNATAMSTVVVALMVVADLVKRVLQADELHDPTWIGHPQEQPEHMKTIIRFQVCLHSQKQSC